MTQEYICTACCYAGAVVVRDHAGVFEVLSVLRADHEKNSPECRAVIRVRNPELCTPEEWEFTKDSVRQEREFRQERDDA